MACGAAGGSASSIQPGFLTSRWREIQEAPNHKNQMPNKDSTVRSGVI
jgi:hypothetical protein